MRFLKHSIIDLSSLKENVKSDNTECKKETRGSWKNGKYEKELDFFFTSYFCYMFNILDNNHIFCDASPLHTMVNE